MKSKTLQKKRGRSTAKVTIPAAPLGNGAIAFWINHAHADWTVNNQNYKFGPIENDRASVSAFKKSDLSLEVRFMTPNFGHTFSAAIPRPFEKGVHVAVTWTPEEIILRLNDRAVSSAPLKPTTR
jgi:hypothetical protein